MAMMSKALGWCLWEQVGLEDHQRFRKGRQVHGACVMAAGGCDTVCTNLCNRLWCFIICLPGRVERVYYHPPPYYCENSKKRISWSFPAQRNPVLEVLLHHQRRSQQRCRGHGAHPTRHALLLHPGGGQLLHAAHEREHLFWHIVCVCEGNVNPDRCSRDNSKTPSDLSTINLCASGSNYLQKPPSTYPSMLALQAPFSPSPVVPHHPPPTTLPTAASHGASQQAHMCLHPCSPCS